MALFCLPPSLTQKFLQSVSSGKLDIEKMIDMKTSAERRDYLSEFVGKENAKEVNTLFEERLLLRNQEKGMIDWIKTVGGLKETEKKTFIDKVKDMKEVLSSEERASFLEDVADKKLGLGVSEAELKTLVDLSEKMKNTSEVNNVADLVKQIDEMKGLTKEQKKAVDSLKEKLQTIEDEKQAAKDREKELNDKIKQQKEDIKNAEKIEKAKAYEHEQMLKDLERNYQKEQKAEQKQKIAEEKIKERGRKEAQKLIQQEKERQLKEFEKQLDRERRAAAKTQEKLNREEFKTSISTSLKGIREAFGGDLPEHLQNEIDDITSARKQISLGGDRLEYGKAFVDLENYVKELKGEETLKEKFSTVGKSIETVAGTAKGIKASLDDSGVYRPGLKMLFTNPEIHLKNVFDQIRGLDKRWGTQAVADGVRADIVSRENFRNGRAKKAGLAVGSKEEPFQETLIEKIPYAGRPFKAADNAFTLLAQKNRMDLFEKEIARAEKKGYNVDDEKFLKDLGIMVNSLTGRGYLFNDAGERISPFLNLGLFSARNFKSNLDTLTAHGLGIGSHPYVRRRMLTNSAKIIGVLGVMLAAAAKAGLTDPDPRSADFGKIKVGDTRFDITAGLASIITLVAREALQSTKSSTTGKITDLNAVYAKGKNKGEPVYGAKTTNDVLGEFFKNKLSPIVATVLKLTGHQYKKDKKNPVIGTLQDLFQPLPASNIAELAADPKAANIVWGSLFDSIGIGANTWQ